MTSKKARRPSLASSSMSTPPPPLVVATPDEDDDDDGIVTPPPPRRSSLRDSLRNIQSSVGLDHPRPDYGGGEAGRGVQVWHVAVGLLALLDCAANLLEGAGGDGAPVILDGRSDEQPEGGQGDFITWLRMRRKEVGVLFSLAWMVDSVIVATFVRVPRCQRLHREGVRSMRLDEALEAERDCKGGMGTPLGVYFRVISFHLLVLPISVYLYIYDALFRPGEHAQVNGVEATIKEACFESFRSKAHRSFVMAVVESYASRALRASHVMKESGKAQLHALAIRKILANVHRPRKLWRQVHHVLTILRWLMYLSTMLGPLGNLIDRVIDFRKRYKQRRDARVALKERKRRLTCMNAEEAATHCARMVQATYRSKRARRNVRALQLIQRNEEQIAALTMQHALQAALLRARRTIKEHHDQLYSLRTNQRELLKREKRMMSSKERQYLHQMEKELSEEFFWNFIMVLCALVEILTLASVLRSNYEIPQSLYSKNRRLYESIVVTTFMAAPAARLNACRDLDECVVSGSGLLRRLLYASCWFRDRRMRHSKQAPRPQWWCSPVVSRAQQLVISAFPGVTHAALSGFIMIANLDVFVKFFTADIDPWTGSLRPRSFVKRWIFPGLLFQLLVNPQVELTSDVLAHLVSVVVRHGPYRVLCWMAAFGYPSYRAIRSTVLYAWIQMLDESNETV